MKKLHQYLIRQFIGPFFAVLFVVVFALALEFLWVYIDELVGKGLGLGVIFEFMAWASATLLPLSFPLATLLASIMTLGNLGERNELLAMKAAGISLTRIMVPVFALSVIISIGAFLAANNLVPLAYNKIYTLRADIARTKNEIKIPTGTFYNGIDGYVLRIDSRDKDGTMHDLIIYDHTSFAGNTNMILAESGKINTTGDKNNLIFDLYNGCSYQEENFINYRDTSVKLSRINFDYQQITVPLENYSFSRSDDVSFGDEVMAKNLRELAHDKDSIGVIIDSVNNVHYLKFVSGMGLYYMSQLDTIVKNWKLKGKLPLDSIVMTLDAETECGMLRHRFDEMSEHVNTVEGYVIESRFNKDTYLRTDTEGYRKFTLSIACLLFFFIGAPLGAIIRKGGLGTPVVISVFFFLVYYVIDTVGKRLSYSGAMDPFVGTFISAAVLLPIGIFLTRKSTQDSAIFNMDTYKEFFKRIRKKASKAYHRLMNSLFSKSGGRIRIVFMGTPEFAVAQLDALMKSEYEVAAVVTVPDKPSGRGLAVNESAVKKYAIEHNLPVLQPVKLKDPQFLEQLRSFNANLFVVVAFRMLPQEVWRMPAYGTFNLHASLLPQYRGAAPINWAVINGERFSGVTTFMIDEDIDTGKILYQESCAIEPYETAGDLHDKLMKMGCDLVLKTVDAIESHKVKPVDQMLGMDKELKPAPKLTKELCHIDWNQDVDRIAHLIRGLSPYPAAYTTLVRGDEVLRVKIYDAYDSQIDLPELPVGSINLDGKHIQVKCGNGVLRIFSLQIAGKKRMKVDEFLRGFRELDSWHFE